jgi:two-component system sensor histidine kinase TtrS
MESYLQRFLALGRDRPLASEDVCLPNIVEDVLALVRPACIHAGIELEWSPPKIASWVRGDPEALRQLMANLLTNAIEAASQHRPSAGRPRIAIEVEQVSADRVAVNIRDTGPGPGAEVLDRLFEPFVSEKPEGTGLGLYVARQLAESHQGVIRWRRDGKMTCFTVEFPTILPA